MASTLSRFHRIARCILALPLAWNSLAAQNIVFQPLEASVIEQRFARLQPKNADRADALRTIFREAGCPAEQWAEPKVRDSKLPNLICTLLGSSERTVIITAHYDKVNAGEGAIDNWSGASLLPSLYESLRYSPRTLTYVFLLTTDEEKGLYGATDYVRKLKKEQIPSIVADVNLDSLGLAGPTYAWHSRADKNLWDAALRVADALELPLRGMNIDAVGDSDSHPFVTKKIPVIDFHSLNSETIKLLHTSKDVPSAHDPASYFNSFRL